MQSSCCQHKREKSFDNKYSPWPWGINQKPADLAEAGFYYYGVGDRVLCFYCNGGLHNWDLSDNPWTEHAAWFPDCGYLLLKKGSAFVEGHRQHQDPTKEGLKSINRSTLDHQKESYSSCRSVDQLNESDQSQQVQLESITEEGVTFSSNSILVSNHKILEILEENRKLREGRLCKVCFTKDREIIFAPCGHFMTCLDCRLRFEKCPVCRAKIISIVKTYMS